MKLMKHKVVGGLVVVAIAAIAASAAAAPTTDLVDQQGEVFNIATFKIKLGQEAAFDA